MERPASGDLEVTKAKVRVETRQRMDLLPADVRQEAAHRVCERILAEPAWQCAKTVLLFAPLPDEVDVWPLFAQALRSGKQVALPRFNAVSRTYEPVFVRDEEDLVVGRYGIREPKPDLPSASIVEFDWILVPGVAFDTFGHRLGRGAGYYDRLLADARGRKVGVCFAEQLVAALPAAAHDVRMDLVILPDSTLARPWTGDTLPRHE